MAPEIEVDKDGSMSLGWHVGESMLILGLRQDSIYLHVPTDDDYGMQLVPLGADWVSEMRRLVPMKPTMLTPAEYERVRPSFSNVPIAQARFIPADFRNVAWMKQRPVVHAAEALEWEAFLAIPDLMPAVADLCRRELAAMKAGDRTALPSNHERRALQYGTCSACGLGTCPYGSCVECGAELTEDPP